MVKISDLEKINIPLKEQAKSIVVLAFRNGPIENIHAGKGIKIPNTVSRITDDEMKKMMKFAVNFVYGLLWLKEHRPNLYKVAIASGLMSTGEWDDPNISIDPLSKIDLKKDRDFVIKLAKCLTGERADIK